MDERKKIGALISELNTKWLKEGIRITLYIWEDFIIGYSGKHKQEEYIDEMVLPSDLCFFLFSHRVGKFTRMELEAKLAQDKEACFCYRLQSKGKWIDSVADDLKSMGIDAIDVSTEEDLLLNIREVIENYLAKKAISNADYEYKSDLYFYTTIPDDVKTICKNIDKDIDTQMRNVDDFTMDEWGIHCVLHPRKNFGLMDSTDHYIPLLAKDVTDEDLKELEYGIEKCADRTHRIMRTTMFDFDNVYKKNAKIKDLIDNKGGGIFTDKVKDLGDVKWKLLDWIRKSKNDILSTNTMSITVDNNNLLINDVPFVPITTIDENNEVTKLVAERRKIEKDIELAISNKSDYNTMQELTDKRSRTNGVLGLVLLEVLNSSSFINTSHSDESKALVEKCSDLHLESKKLLSSDLNKENAVKLKEILLKKEDIEQKLVNSGNYSPLRLIITQFILVSLFDTFFNQFCHSKEEDEVYKRLISVADKYDIKIPFVECIRMNMGNMYSRKGNYRNARIEYQKAISNLEKYPNKGKNLMRYITCIYTHLFHLEEEYGSRDTMTEVLASFEKHIHSLDMADNYHFPDLCMYMTAKLTSIDIYDSSNRETVEAAEELFREVNNRRLSMDNYLFGDIYVYMPNMIARYYIDHHDDYSSDDVPVLLNRANNLIGIGLSNAEKLLRVNYSEGLTHKGSLHHQRGYLYAMNPKLALPAIVNYKEALAARTGVFELSGNESDELEIAQTLVNYGALELEILKGKYMISYPIQIQPLWKACKAMEIYQRHLIKGNLFSETRFYQAKLLFATVLYQQYEQETSNKLLYNYATNVLLDCWDWNKKHIDNQYRNTIIDYAVPILRKHNFISEQEVEDVRKLLIVPNK